MFTDYCVLDFETSGLNPHTDYAIEAAIIRVRNNQITATDAFFIRPHKGFVVSSQTTRLTGITQENIDAGISPDDAYFRIRDFIGQDCIVCHNAPFDMGFLMSLARRSSDPLRVPTLCTLALSRKAFPLLANHKLVNLAKEFGLPPPTHRAQADCLTTHELIQLIGTKLDRRPSRKFYEHTYQPKQRPSLDAPAPAPSTPYAAERQKVIDELDRKAATNRRNGRILMWCLPLLFAAVASALTGGTISIGALLVIILIGFLVAAYFRQFL